MPAAAPRPAPGGGVATDRGEDAPAAAGAARRPINLALQGGGAHGAFTWGVLDRLLEDGRFRFESVSGASAGAVNAVALAAGLAEGGAAAARSKLEAIWRGAIELARFSPLRSHPMSWLARTFDWSFGNTVLDLMTRLYSPNQLNPFDINPLRDLVARHVDFAAIAERRPVALWVAATDVATGLARLFSTKEMTLDVVIASASLPHLHQAVRIGDNYYWDGGFSANPPVVPLVEQSEADDTLIVQVNPDSDAAIPTTASEIAARVNRLTFNAPLRREIALIERCRALADDGLAFGGPLRRRYRDHRFHLIEGAAATAPLGEASKLTPNWGLVMRLKDAGRAAASDWLDRNFAALGRRSTVDLAAKFL
jgi:NTE family protein